MKNESGFTLVEAMVVVSIIIVALIPLFGLIFDNRGVTEDRARTGASAFIQDNGLEVKRFTCAGDSNNDGYGTCTVVLTDGDRIRLSCPTGYAATKVFGASSCKEVFQDVQVRGNGFGLGQ